MYETRQARCIYCAIVVLAIVLGVLLLTGAALWMLSHA